MVPEKVMGQLAHAEGIGGRQRTVESMFIPSAVLLAQGIRY